MGSMITDPFGPAIEEVHLDHAPLALVVAQVRFPTITSIAEEQSFIAPFQERLRADYPVLRHEFQTQLILGPEGPMQQNTGRLWRFNQHGGPWSVALASDFVALSTSQYTSRRDFLDRLRRVLKAFEEWLQPAICDRLGVRYVDRVHDPRLLTKLDELLRPEILGVCAVQTGDDAVTLKHSLADSTFTFADDSELHGRWGLLPAQTTFDPAIEPSAAPSWVLDIDVYTTSSKDFSGDALADRAYVFAERVYRFFRWAVTDAFLDEHGAHR